MIYVLWQDTTVVTALFTAAALLVAFRLRWPIMRVLGLCALLGLGTAVLPWTG
ncbi:hypothetical protein ACIBEJ_24885 [Nonomuraea sp. NPDC050790]|uniref:hypothetical protein n=1 Tax=Nonomuraea sp. NPDC050790 TaxID=3364371 RepID=UPI0037B99453